MHLPLLMSATIACVSRSGVPPSSGAGRDRRCVENPFSLSDSGHLGTTFLCVLPTQDPGRPEHPPMLSCWPCGHDPTLRDWVGSEPYVLVEHASDGVRERGHPEREACSTSTYGSD